MSEEIKEIKLEKRKPTFDYILNDLAFDSLMFRVVNGIGSSQDKFDFDYQIKLMQQEISHLRQNNNWDKLKQWCIESRDAERKEKWHLIKFDKDLEPIIENNIQLYDRMLTVMRDLESKGDE